MLNRRQVLIGGSASLLLPYSSHVLASGDNQILDAAPKQFSFYEGAAVSNLWAYNGTLPGPELRYRRGDRAKIQFRNQLDQGSTIHWHGIRIANAMDGVAGLTQAPVEPHDAFLYEFDLPDAGTYWYHPHNRSWEQMARGLYGALIVEEDKPYPVDQDQVLILDDWRLNEAGALDEASFGNRHDWSHGGRLGNWATVNGISTPTYSFRKQDRVRLRIINSSNARVMPILLLGLNGTLIALDGQPLAQPANVTEREEFVLAPAQRADLVVDMTAPGALAVANQEDPIPLAAFSLDGEAVSGLSDEPVPKLPGNDVPLPSPAAGKHLSLVMEGGAMRWLQEGNFKGATLDGRALAELGQFWSFNGQVGRSDRPFFEAARGQTVVLEIHNKTAWPHSMHLHGHHFIEVGQESHGAALAPLRDTILVERESAKTIAFVADNPGKWMLHCHMLEHQAAGMGTWFNVS